MANIEYLRKYIIDNDEELTHLVQAKFSKICVFPYKDSIPLLIDELASIFGVFPLMLYKLNMTDKSFIVSRNDELKILDEKTINLLAKESNSSGRSKALETLGKCLIFQYLLNFKVISLENIMTKTYKSNSSTSLGTKSTGSEENYRVIPSVSAKTEGITVIPSVFAKEFGDEKFNNIVYTRKFSPFPEGLLKDYFNNDKIMLDMTILELLPHPYDFYREKIEEVFSGYRTSGIELSRLEEFKTTILSKLYKVRYSSGD